MVSNQCCVMVQEKLANNGQQNLKLLQDSTPPPASALTLSADDISRVPTVTMADNHLHENSHKTQRTVPFDSSAWTLCTLHQDSCWGELITSGEQRLLSQQRQSERNTHLCFVPKYNFSSLVLEKFSPVTITFAAKQYLHYCATSWKKAGSTPDNIGIFYWLNPSVRTMTLPFTFLNSFTVFVEEVW
jgi:hypothetical protein